MLNTNITLFTSEQVCEILKVCRRTLSEYRKKGTITFIQCRRKILYTEADISAFLEAHHIKGSYGKGVQL